MNLLDKLGLTKVLGALGNKSSDVYCANCGVRTGRITRQRLFDDKCVCLRCQNMLPSCYKEDDNLMPFGEYKRVLDYVQGESAELKKKFKKKIACGDLQLDTASGILRYSSRNGAVIYLRLSKISYLDVSTHYEDVEDKVPDLHVMIYTNDHLITIDEDSRNSALEDDCKKFMDYYRAFGMYGEQGATGDYTAKLESEAPPHAAQSEDAELSAALALFMFDSIDEVTEENLKAQRNRLIKSFHPDTGSEKDTKYARKINEAYEVLRDRIKS